METILLEAKKEGNLTEEDAWLLYVVVSGSIMQENDIIPGLQKTQSNSVLEALMGAGKDNPYGTPFESAFPINEGWSKTFGGKYPDFPSAMQQTSDGGYMFIGTTRSFASFVQIETGENAEWIKTNTLALLTNMTTSIFM